MESVFRELFCSFESGQSRSVPIPLDKTVSN